jgi:AcrR family transcriptional regulator
VSRSSDGLSDIVREARRTQIVDAARALINEQGLDALSVDDIAAAAGVARSTVYNHFADRDEIVRECLARAHRDLMAALRTAFDVTKPPRQQLVDAFELLIRIADRNAGLGRLGLGLAAGQDAGRSPGVNAEMLVMGLETADLWRRALTQLSDQGDELGGHSVEKLVQFSSRLLIGILNERVHGNRLAEPAELARDAWSILLPEPR